MGRQENIDIFKDTQQMNCRKPRLAAAILQSNEQQEYFVQGKRPVDVGKHTYENPAQIIVSAKRTLKAAEAYAYAGKKVCVLNFASATNPGGGVVKGSSAQEEAICRCSTLYPSLKEQRAWDAFYAPHRQAQDPLHNDDCIYTPGVVVFKSDTAYPMLLPEEKRYVVNVITCAAPNLRERPSNGMNSGDGDRAVRIGRKELQELHESRMRKVLEIAAAKGNEVVILGAFGCGAFRNSPTVVAQAMKTVVQEYRKNFETIEFAVYCSRSDDVNYRTFQQELGRL